MSMSSPCRYEYIPNEMGFEKFSFSCQICIYTALFSILPFYHTGPLSNAISTSPWKRTNGMVTLNFSFKRFHESRFIENSVQTER